MIKSVSGVDMFSNFKEYAGNKRVCLDCVRYDKIGEISIQEWLAYESEKNGWMVFEATESPEITLKIAKHKHQRRKNDLIIPPDTITVSEE
jgi:hypothetical protein